MVNFCLLLLYYSRLMLATVVLPVSAELLATAAIHLGPNRSTNSSAVLFIFGITII